MPVWAWAAIGAGLVLVTAIALAAMRRRKASDEIVALVLLCPEASPLGEERVRRAAQAVFGASLIEVVGAEAERAGSYMIPTQMGMFLVNNMRFPYVPDVAAEAAGISDLRRRELFAKHRAWRSADVMGPPPPEERPQVYRTLARLLGEVADDSSLLLYRPEDGAMVPVTPQVVAALKRGDVDKAFGGLIPVLGVEASNVEMKQAVQEARKRWPEFVRAFEAAGGEGFAVKTAFREGEDREFMWVLVDAIEGEHLAGRLDNDPVHITRFKAGARVRVKAANICDWLYVKDGAMVGNFTMGPLERAQGG